MIAFFMGLEVRFASRFYFSSLILAASCPHEVGVALLPFNWWNEKDKAENQNGRPGIPLFLPVRFLTRAFPFGQ